MSAHNLTQLISIGSIFSSFWEGKREIQEKEFREEISGCPPTVLNFVQYCMCIEYGVL